MSCKCCLHGMVCRLGISNLTYHYNIRILAQYRPQCRGKVHAYIMLNTDLIEFLHYHLYRVFNRYYINLRGGEVLQGRIQGRRLTASGRAGYEYDAVVLRQVRVK